MGYAVSSSVDDDYILNMGNPGAWAATAVGSPELTSPAITELGKTRSSGR